MKRSGEAAVGVAWGLLVDPDGRPGAENMAIDRSLLDNAAESGVATLRLYRWDPPCLSFGRNEPESHYDPARIKELGIDVVRRPTGGSAVWHEHELTYAVAAPIETFGSLRKAYCAIHERLAVALRSLGADVSLAPDRRVTRPPPYPTACFGAALGGEILAQGRKLVGSAQVRKRRAFLQHGSILLAGSQEMIGATGSTTLSTVLGRPVTFDEVAEAVVIAFADRLTARPPPHPTAQTWRR